MKLLCTKRTESESESELDSVSPSLGGELGESGGKIETRGVRYGTQSPMPSVGMRRTTRVFGVVKGVDGARVLRSGRRLWPESVEDKLKRGNDGDEWFKLIDNSAPAAGRLNCKENGWHEHGSKQGDATMETDHKIAVPQMRKNVSSRVLVNGGDNQGGGDGKWGIVYSRRKRKRFYGTSSVFSGNLENDRGLEDRMYGIQFVRRKRSRMNPVVVVAGNCALEADSVEVDVSHREMLVVVVEPSCSITCWVSRFLNSVLGYMKRARLRLSDLSAFMFSELITHVFSSHGIHFLQDPARSNSSGLCKIFGTRQFVPLFSVDFSALPRCFMYIHSTMLLRSEHLLLSFLLTCSMSMDSDSETVTDSEEHLPYNPPKRDLSRSKHVTFEYDNQRDLSRSKDVAFRDDNQRDLSPNKDVTFADDNPWKRRVLHPTVGAAKFPRRTPQNRNALNSRSIQGKRSSLRSRRVRNPSLVGVHKANNGTLGSDFFSVRNNCPFSSAASYNKRRRSAWSSSTGNIKELKSAVVSFREDIDLSCCSANILVIESDKCYREEGAKIMLELSPSNQWFLVVKANGSTRYSHKAQKVMRPCSSNRVTHAIIWTGDDGWKLEFPNRQDWLIFKELYKECCERSVPDESVKIIPVPGVREVSGYGDSNSAPFSLPDSYITLNGNEVSRALAKRTSNYDMDSEDEEWLDKLNSEFCAENEHVSEENFELMVDAFEKALYCNPDDCSNDKAAANLCLDLGRREVVEAVYSYWMNKRKHKRSVLVRVFQGHQTRRAQLITEPVLRKKRSFKRQASQSARGKRLLILQAMAAEQDAFDEQNALHKVEEAKASVNKSVEVAVGKRKRAQFFMENADLATYKATMALRIAEAARVCKTLDSAAANFLDE